MTSIPIVTRFWPRETRNTTVACLQFLLDETVRLLQIELSIVSHACGENRSAR